MSAHSSAEAGAERFWQQQQSAEIEQDCQFAMIVSMLGDAGGLGALDDAPMLLLLLLLLGLGCSRDPTQALSTADSPLLRVALLLSATGRLACAMQ